MKLSIRLKEKIKGAKWSTLKSIDESLSISDDINYKRFIKRVVFTNESWL